MSRLGAWVRRALWDVVPRDHQESRHDLRRRQLVTLAVVVVGATVLGFSLRLDPGSRSFYPATLALAAVWLVGAFASGPLHLGRITAGRGTSRPVLPPIVLGLALAGVFVAGAFLVRTLDLLDGLEGQVVHVVDYADQGSGPLLAVVTTVNGVAEELFFRGAAYAATPRYPVAVTTVAYTLATLATGNVMLAFAAVLLGVLVGLQRRASGGILGPILTHVTWSVSMLFLLPWLFG
jgi:membrane protease YdiL (CAAX protease family)